MKKTICALVLILSMVFAISASAELTNRDLQLTGGLVAINASDTFFFSPMEEGVTKHWGLYAMSKMGDGPIVEITDGWPAAFFGADNSKVYFFGYTDYERTLFALYSVEIKTGKNELMLDNIAEIFVDDGVTGFYYVQKDDLFTLRKYTISTKKAEKVKDMSASSKTIYDAIMYKGTLYFTTKAVSNGNEDGYKFNPSSGKAINLTGPKPTMKQGFLYEGYRIYSTDAAGTRVYSAKIDSSNGKPMGAKYFMSLANPRFGEAMYAYDSENNALVRCPLDGSSENTLMLEGGVISRLLLGGSVDELLMYSDYAIYSIKPDLSSKTKLFDFQMSTGGQVWSYIMPAQNGNILMMGYGAETYTHSDNMMPTGVYIYDRSGNELFSFPEFDPDAVIEKPLVLGDPGRPEDYKEEETYFVF